MDNPAISQADLLSHFNSKWGTSISKSTMSNVIRERSKWLATDMHTGSRLTERPCANKQLEEVLYLWFITNGPAGKGGDILGEEFREMAAELDKDPRFEVKSNFKFSNGWLEGFKKRYNIKQYTRFGEAASADSAVIENGREEIASLIAQYPPNRVYNMDETAKQYNMRPTRTLATSKVAGFKQSKERLTIAVCANADGSDKYGLYVIGKAKKTRSFPKDWTPRLLGITWTSNKTAWMNTKTFRVHL